MSRKAKRGATKRSVSMPRDMEAAAVTRGQSLGRNLSNYVQWLISEDLSRASAPALVAQPEAAR